MLRIHSKQFRKLQNQALLNCIRVFTWTERKHLICREMFRLQSKNIELFLTLYSQES